MSLRYQGREVTIGEGRKSATLGRAEDNDVVVKGNLISRVHARIEASRDKFTLVDESTNGTFVQTNTGEEIFVRRDSTPLTGEGVIGLGRVAQPGTALAVDTEWGQRNAKVVPMPFVDPEKRIPVS